MDRAPRKLPNIASRLIAMACAMVSAEHVREAMGASPEDFELYQAGAKEPLAHEFHCLVDLIVEKQSEQVKRSRDLLKQIREKMGDR